MGIATEWKWRRKRKTLPRTHHSSARVNTTRLTNPFVSRAVFSLEESSSVPPPLSPKNARDFLPSPPAVKSVLECLSFSPPPSFFRFREGFAIMTFVPAAPSFSHRLLLLLLLTLAHSTYRH